MKPTLMSYIALVETHSPKVMMMSDGVTIYDASSNTLALGETVILVVDYDQHGIPHTEANYAWMSNEYNVNKVPPYFVISYTANLFTVTFWYRKDTYTHAVMPTAIGANLVNVNMDGTGFGFNTYNGDMTGIPKAKVQDGKWHHVALRADASDIRNTTRIWVDGVEETVSVNTGTAVSRNLGGSSHNAYAISGHHGATTYEEDEGKVFGVSWFEGYLSEAQIQAQADYNFGTELDSLSEKVMAKKPFAYWKFWTDDPANTVRDNGIGSNDLTITGTHSRTVGGLAVETSIAEAGYLDIPLGTYANTPTDTSKWTRTLSECTVEAWVWFDSPPTANEPFTSFSVAPGDYATFNLQTDMDFYTGMYDAANFPTDEFRLETGKLYHLVETSGTFGRKVYINGRLILHTTSTNTPNVETSSIHFARGTSNGVSANDMRFYEFAFYNDRFLTDSEVYDHYTTGSGSYSQQAYNEAVMADSPIAYFPCDIESPTSPKVFDITGNYSHLDVAVGNGGFGNSGQNGVGAYQHTITTTSPTKGAIDGTNGLTQVTFEGWVNVTDWTNVQGSNIFFEFNANIEDSRQGWGNNANDYLRMRVKHGNVTESNFSTAYSPPTLNKWYHYAMTIDYSTGACVGFINGIKVFTGTLTTVSGALTQDYWIVLGAYIYDGYEIAGSFQHIAVYSGILPESTFRARYELMYPKPVDTSDYASLILADDPVCYWKLNEITGNTVADQMSRVNGTIVNSSADIMAEPGLDPYNNPSEKALRFDGMDDYIDLEDVVPYFIKHGFSIELLCDFTVPTNTYDMLFAIQGGTVEGISVFVKNTGIISFEYYQASGDGKLHQTTKTVTHPGRLGHIIVTYDGTQYFKIYFNGEVIADIDAGAGYEITWTGNAPMVIGRRVFDSNYPLSSKMAHFAMYDHILSLDRIKARVKTLLGQKIAEANSYTTLVQSDNPSIYLPFNDKYNGNYASFYENDGQVANLSNQVDYFKYNQTGIVVGGGGCIETVHSPTENQLFIPTDSTLLSIAQGTMTVEVWFNANSVATNTDNRLITWMHEDTSSEAESHNYLIAVRIEPDGSIELFWEYGAGSNVSTVLFPSGSVVSGQTYHLTIHRDNGLKQCWGYLNGVKSTVFNYSNNPTGGNDPGCGFKFGHDIPNTGRYFDGFMSHVAIYNSILPETRILDHYYQGIGLIPNTYQYQVRQDGPIAHWALDGATFTDSVGSWTYTPSNVSTGQTGLYKGSGGSAYFDGVTEDCGRYSGASGSTPLASKNICTIEMWVQPDSTGIMDIAYNEAAAGGVVSQVGVASDELMRFRFHNGTGWTDVAYSPEYIPVGKVSHLVFTRNGRTVEFFINGVSVGTGDLGATYGNSAFNSASQYVSIGSMSATNQTFLKSSGYIDSVTIWDRICTAQEILDRYNAGVQGTHYERLLNRLNATSHVSFDSNYEDHRRGISGTVLGTASLDASGKLNGSLSVNDGDVHFSDVDALDPGTTSFTAAAWFKIPATTSDSQRIWEKKGIGTADGWQIATSSTGAEDYSNSGVWKSASQLVMISSASAVTMFDNLWHQAVITYDSSSGTLKMYHDGVLRDTQVNAALIGLDINNTEPYGFGRSSNAQNQKVVGNIDEGLFFRRELTPTEVQELYDAYNPNYKITGTVTQDGVPVSRDVFAVDRATKKCVGTAVSSSIDGAFEILLTSPDPLKEYVVTALDDDDQIILDPITHDRITAVAV